MSEASFESTPNIEFDSSDTFLRRIPPWHCKEGKQISSAAFQNDDSDAKSFSTNWEKRSSVMHTLSFIKPPFNPKDWGVARISNITCCELGQQAVYSPKSDNDAHSDVTGEKTTSICRKFRNKAEYLQLPTPC